MTAEPRSIDATLVRAMQDNAQAPVQPAAPEPEVGAPPAAPVPDAADVSQGTQPANDPGPPPAPSVPAAEPLPEAAKPGGQEGEGSPSSPIDEYGNPVAKPRVYTEDEVQRMIRDRLSRGRHAAEQPAQANADERRGTQASAEQPAPAEDWEAQLKQFVRKTNLEIQQEEAQRQYQQQELQRQAEFEDRFSRGMNRYGDFREVVGNKPITDTMMVATRALEDPAAFLYGASRMHPQEIDRISRIADPIAVAAEVGRLHERMVKERKALSNAPRPVEPPRGDMPRTDDSRIPIDTLISQHAQRKFARR